MPSLTLTDPDMILPYDGSERQSSTPSPPSQLVYLSNLNARYSSADPHGSSAPRPKKNFSRHAWSNEEGTSSRRLSDIGEELSPARIGGFEVGSIQSPDQVLASSPLLPEQLGTPETKEHAAWSSSNSTISAGSRRPSRDVTSPQNVNNANIAPHAPVEPAPEPSENETKPGMPDGNVLASAAKGKGPGDEFSSAILSSEAERILDNAKQRLTVRGDPHTPRRGRAMLTILIANGRQSQPRAFVGASHALALALGPGQHPAHGPIPTGWGALPIHNEIRTQEPHASPAAVSPVI